MARRPITYDEQVAAQIRWKDYDKTETTSYQKRKYSKESVRGEDDPWGYLPENIDIYRG